MQVARLFVVLARLTLGYAALKHEGYGLGYGNISLLDNAVGTTAAALPLGAVGAAPAMARGMLHESAWRENTAVLVDR